MTPPIRPSCPGRAYPPLKRRRSDLIPANVRRARNRFTVGTRDVTVSRRSPAAAAALGEALRTCRAPRKVGTAQGRREIESHPPPLSGAVYPDRARAFGARGTLVIPSRRPPPPRCRPGRLFSRRAANYRARTCYLAGAGGRLGVELRGVPVFRRSGRIGFAEALPLPNTASLRGGTGEGRLRC